MAWETVRGYFALAGAGWVVALQLASCAGDDGGPGDGDSSEGGTETSHVEDGGVPNGGASTSVGGALDAGAGGDWASGGQLSDGGTGLGGHAAEAGAEGVEVCYDDYCLNGGSCMPSETGIACACPDDFAGARCERDTRIRIIQVASSGARCGLTPDHDVVCWGPNVPGVQYGGAAEPPHEKFLTLASGEGRACGVRMDGTVLCWGSADASPLAGTFNSLSVSYGFGCAIRSDDTLACWGTNSVGQATPPEGEFQQVVLSDDHACALSTAGAISCWGAPYTEAAPVGKFQRIVVGDEFGCALQEGGEVTCWGSNIDIYYTPPSGTFRDLAGSGSQVCGLRDNGSVECWGAIAHQPPAGAKFSALGLNAGYGILEDGTYLGWGGLMATNYPPGGTYSAIASSRHLTCRQHTSGRLDCWGLAAPPSTEKLHGVSVAEDSSIDGGLTARAHGCGLNEQNRIVCWGKSVAASATPPPGQFKSVLAGQDFSCALDLDGHFQCWGKTTHPPADKFERVVLRGTVACGLHEDSTLTCWDNITGEGIVTPPGEYLDAYVHGGIVCAMRLDRTIVCPLNVAKVPVPGDIAFKAFDVGDGIACGVRDDDKIECWSPYLMLSKPDDSAFASVSLGFAYCGIRIDRTLSCWNHLVF